MWPSGYSTGLLSCALSFQRHDRLAITKDHCLMQLGVWGVVSLSASPEGEALVGVQGAKPPEDLEILHFTVPRRGQNHLFSRVVNTKSEEKFIQFRNLLGVPNKVHKVLQVLLNFETRYTNKLYLVG